MSDPERVQPRVRKKFAGRENGSSRVRLMPLQLKKRALVYPVFLLCSGMQWLFCEEPQGLRSGEREKQSGTMLVDDHLTDKKTAVAVRMPELPDADGIPKPSSWGLSAPVRFCADWYGRHSDPEREMEGRLLLTLEILYLRFA